LHQPLNVLAGKYVRNWPRGVLGTQDRRWQFVALIFGMRVSSESNHDTEPAGSLTCRSSLSCPLDSNIGANVMVTAGIGECGEASQAGAF
jgi:hypothetical protein